MNSRLKKEIHMLESDPPPGVCAWPVCDSLNHLQAQVKGPESTPYADGIFLLDIEVPDRYPFDPPRVRFETPIYHPNIDTNGRICLDTLKMPPAGSWKPSINIPTLLTTIRTLIAHPNGEDGLMPDITRIFLDHRAQFDKLAREHTLQHATSETLSISASVGTSENSQSGEGANEVPKKESTASSCSSSSDNESDDNLDTSSDDSSVDRPMKIQKK